MMPLRRSTGDRLLRGREAHVDFAQLIKVYRPLDADAQRRFTRLTNAFSKKAENHAAAIALHVAYYNLCRTHEAIRCTPVMALGVADHVWTIGELIDAALSATESDPVPTGPVPYAGMSAAEAKGGQTAIQPKRSFYVIKGGKK